METTIESVNQLRGFLSNLNCKILFVSLEGDIWGCNVPRYRVPAAWQTQLRMERKPLEEGAFLYLPGESYRVHLCFADRKEYFYVLIPDAEYSWISPFIDTLVKLNYQDSEDSLLSIPHQRRILTSQLANFGSISTELHSAIHVLGYSPNIYRAAILCSASVTDVFSSDMPAQSGQLSLDYFADCMEAFPGYGEEDIYGAISNNRYLIFKAVPSGSPLEYRETVEEFLTHLTDFLQDKHIAEPVFGIGSAYDSFFQLSSSYREADFLLTNHAFLCASLPKHLFIHNYLLEYLLHSHRKSEMESLFRDFSELLSSKSSLSDTVVALSQNDYVLSQTARAIGLHRNTMLQRYARLNQEYALDPMHRVYDRLLLRAMMLPRMCAVTLNAGIHLQPGSLQYVGLVKLSEVLYQVSHGTMQINIHHISTSGDNQHLLKIIGSNSLDLGLCGCAALYSISEDLASLIEQPFLFDSVEQAVALLNQIILPLLTETLQNEPVICPAFWVIGSRHITSRDVPIRTPKDLQGKSIRTMSYGALYSYFSQLGANPVHIAYNELHNALSTGLVDCQENPYVNILGIRLDDVQHYINDMVYYYNISPLFISRETWQELSEEQQGFLVEAIEITTNWLIQEQQTINDHCRAVLEQEKGMVVFSPTESEKKLWLKEARAFQKKHVLQKHLHILRKAREDYNANGSLGKDIQELLLSLPHS